MKDVDWAELGANQRETGKLLKIRVQIVGATDDSTFPAYVRCQFFDAQGDEHIIHEKLPGRCQAKHERS